MLASGVFNPSDERPLFHDVLAATDLSWKQAAFLVENILSAWDETGNPEAIVEYPEFDNPPTKTVLDVVKDAESSYRDVLENPIAADKDVAVIGEDQFTALDRRILPSEYDSIDPFDDHEFQLPEFRIFESPTAIVDAVIENIDEDNSDDIGIVLDESSQYRPLIESAFESASIPYYGGPDFAEDLDVRTFIRLLRVTHAEGQLRVNDVRGILNQLGQFPPIADDEKLLAAVEAKGVTELQSLLTDLDQSRFNDAITSYETWADADLSPLRWELDDLGILDVPVTKSRLDDLEFYLDVFDVPIPRDDHGVLLASARSSVYVDRPVVFYLGLSADWTHSIKDRPWIDADAKDAQYLQQFQLLLQNGQEQYYLVQNTEAGETITPCLYFHDLLDDSVDEFEGLPHVSYGGRLADWSTEAGFSHEPPDAAPDPDTERSLSNSTLKRLVNCPKDDFFNEVVDQPDKDYHTKGNLFHDFAEFYILHPKTVEETPTEELVEFGMEALRPFTENVELPLLKTEIEVGYENIIEFVDTYPPQTTVFDAYTKKWDHNMFAEHFEKEISDSTITEQWFDDEDLGGKGKVDLIHSLTELADFKTSSKNTAKTVVKHADIDAIADKPDFQALLYLAHYRRVVPDEQLSFRFVHLTDNLDDVVTGDAAIEDTFTDVPYHPLSFAEFVATEAAFDLLIEGVNENNNRRKTLEKLGFEDYQTFFADWGFPDVDEKDEIEDREILDAFTAAAKQEVGDYKYVAKGSRSALRKLVSIRNQRFFEDDVDAFEDFLQTHLENLNEYKESGFPVGDDPNWDRVDHRDLILTGGRT